MKTITLKPNQAALILETSEEGAIDVEVAYSEESMEENGFAAAILEVIAIKLVEDEEFQDYIMAEFDEELDEAADKD